MVKRTSAVVAAFAVLPVTDEKKEDPARYTDPSTTCKSYLPQFVDRSRAEGAKPVLVTSVERRRFTTSGTLTPSHGAYPAAMRELAAAKRVPLVDLTTSSTALFHRVGIVWPSTAQ